MIRSFVFPKEIGRATLGAAVLALLAASLSCRTHPRPENFLLITLDTQRADYISAYGSGKASTPNIDRLAREGVLYKNAYSLIPITLPAHASIFFSQPPHTVKNYNNGETIIPLITRPSFVNLFRNEGFATAAFVSLGVLKTSFGLNQGFEEYNDDFPLDRWYLSAGEVNERVFSWLQKNEKRPFFLWVHYSDPHAPYAPPDSPPDFRLLLNGRLVMDTCLKKYTLNQTVLDLRPGRNRVRIQFENEFDSSPDHYLGRLDRLDFEPEPDPKSYQVDFRRGWYIRKSDQISFFKNNCLIDIENPGGPRQVKMTFRGGPVQTPEAAAAGYRREVEYMDGEIGKLWEKLQKRRVFNKTAVLLVGDHGEGLGERQTEFGYPHLGHIHYLYDGYLRVPLVVRDPSQAQKGTVREEYVTLVDVAPTMAALAGIKPFSHFQGRNLLRLQETKSPVILQETYRPEAFKDRFGLLAPPWHLILTVQDGKSELYDIERDPAEKDNLMDSGEAPLEVVPLRQKLEEFARDIMSGKQEPPKIDDKTMELLRALGYIR
jgi:arylsulfatase A-like enzyme